MTERTWRFVGGLVASERDAVTVSGRPEQRWPEGPIEPPATRWVLPDPTTADEAGLVGVGADLEPGTILAAYRAGMFPMPLRRRTLGWWSPDPRGILPLDGLKVSRSLRRSCRRYRVTMDTAFEAVATACADPSRPHGWITSSVQAAYRRLHDLGWAHSVEVWSEDHELVGGLYGLAIGGLFAGESMFHTSADASKVALVHLVDTLNEGGASLLDVQWTTDHLVSLGAVDIPRHRYLDLLADAIARPLPGAFTT